ncbi:hypothetical protein Fmac_011461 [Flemingia macrophylla]|uniref:Pentatricopeptide repeat-containing protein n=1 Tax=Flemingia macrophylla TaxID=520843 RepID=A0ABD1MMI7_9FABA
MGCWVDPDKITYSTLIGGVARSGDLGFALEVFDEMRERGVEPDVVCYYMIIDGFFKTGDFVKAREMWCGMFSEGLEIWERMKMNERKPDLFTYSSLIHGLSEAGNLGGARRVYEEMVRRGVRPDVVMCNAMLKGLCKAGKVEECFELWEEMEKWGSRNVRSCNIVLKVDEAVSLWDGLSEADAATYGVVVHGLCRNGCVNRALQVLEEAGCRGGGVDVDALAYSAMINALCKEGRLGEAGGVVELMNKRGCKLNARVCNVLIGGFVKHSKLDIAIQISREMSSKERVQTRYYHLQHVDYESKMMDTALRLWHQFLDAGPKPDITMYNIVIHRLCSSGKGDDAMQLYSTIRQRKCANLVTHNTVMEGFYKIGNCEMASKIWAYVSEDGLQPDIISYNITLKGLCSCGRVTDAIGYLDDALVRRVLPTVITWNILVRAVIF